VALGGPIGVVAALRADQVGDLGLHHLGHHLQPDRGRGRQQPLADVLGERGEMTVEDAGEAVLQAEQAGRDERQAARLRRRLGRAGVIDGADVRICHWGSSLETWRSLGACHPACPERRTPTSSSTDPGTTSRARATAEPLAIPDADLDGVVATITG